MSATPAEPTEAERKLAHRIWNDALCNSDIPGWRRDALLAQALADQRAKYEAGGNLAADTHQQAAETIRKFADQADAYRNMADGEYLAGRDEREASEREFKAHVVAATEGIAAALGDAKARGRTELAAQLEELCADAVRRAMTPNTYVTVSALRALLGPKCLDCRNGNDPDAAEYRKHIASWRAADAHSAVGEGQPCNSKCIGTVYRCWDDDLGPVGKP